jgi:hypothetical protein
MLLKALNKILMKIICDTTMPTKNYLLESLSLEMNDEVCRRETPISTKLGESCQNKSKKFHPLIRSSSSSSCSPSFIKYLNISCGAWSALLFEPESFSPEKVDFYNFAQLPLKIHRMVMEVNKNLILFILIQIMRIN